MAGENYQRAYDAIQREFDLADLDADAITSYLTSGRIGKHKIKDGKGRPDKWSDGVSSRGVNKIRDFASDIAAAGEIYRKAQSAQDIETINELTKQAEKLKYISYSKDHQTKLDNILTSQRRTLANNDYNQIKDKFNKTDDYDELIKVRREAESLDDVVREKDALINNIDSKMVKIGEELISIKEANKQIRVSEEKELDSIKGKISRARDLTTLERLERQLDEASRNFEIIGTSDAEDLLEERRDRINEEIRQTGVEYNPDF